MKSFTEYQTRAFDPDKDRNQLAHIKDLSVGSRVFDISGHYGTIIKKNDNSVVVRQKNGATVTFQNVALVKPFELVECESCYGSGGFILPCDKCDGSGKVIKWLFPKI